MKRALLSAALFAGLIGFASMSLEAQTKKKTEPATTHAIEIHKTKNGFRYRIVDAEGKTIAMPVASKHWETREEVIKALDELKETLNKAKPIDVKE